MHSSKPIDISKSSLVGLKAELLRKKEEVKKFKELHVQKEDGTQLLFKNKKRKNPKLRENPEKSCSSCELDQDDFDDLKKSREVLEAKARLYDKLKTNSATIGDANNQYLIDFELKEKLKQQDENSKALEESSKLSEDEEDYESDVNSDPENDWVDFVDTLGRSRRCLRRDLPAMKSRDTQLATSLHPPSPPPPTGTSSAQAVEPSPELLSWDMQREIMRKKWEEQETTLLGKKDIHYQDILFDEARPHGVGYFDFSVDEAERERQQEALRRLRKETEEQQQAAAGLRVRRQQQLDARLAAARRRKRERLGLPPDEPQPAEAEARELQNKEEPPKEENIEELKESIKKMAPVRPWDIGKDGVNTVMSQEEWVEMKRKERPAEFAPQVGAEAANETEQEDLNQKGNFFTTKKNKSKFGLKTGFFKAQKHTGKSRSSVLESYNANYSKPLSEEYQKTAENKDYADVEYIGRTLEDMTGSQSFSETHVDKSKGDIWKPTLEDIDDLLSQAKEKCSTDKISSSTEFENDFSFQKEKLFRNHFPNSGLEEKQSSCLPTSDKFVTIPDETSPRLGHNNLSNSKNSNSTYISMIKNEVDLEGCFEELSYHANSNQNKNVSKRKWAEIAPPSSMSYYINEKTGAQTTNTSRVKKEQIADSITAGMSYLKAKTNKTQCKRVKGLLDIV